MSAGIDREMTRSCLRERSKRSSVSSNRASRSKRRTRSKKSDSPRSPEEVSEEEDNCETKPFCSQLEEVKENTCSAGPFCSQVEKEVEEEEDTCGTRPFRRPCEEEEDTCGNRPFLRRPLERELGLIPVLENGRVDDKPVFGPSFTGENLRSFPRKPACIVSPVARQSKKNLKKSILVSQAFAPWQVVLLLILSILHLGLSLWILAKEFANHFSIP